MLGYGFRKAGGDEIKGFVPRRPSAVNFGMEKAAIEIDGFGQSRTLGTQPAEIGGVVLIAFDGNGAIVVDGGDDTAADAAIGTGGFCFNGHGFALSVRGASPPLSCRTSPPQGGRSTSVRLPALYRRAARPAGNGSACRN
ncbi:hypothetical protein D3C87_1250940 [compost metagenome]